jgi:hypothetical protein
MSRADFFTIFTQRTVELLIYYLILANMDGLGLKDAFKELYKNKQQTFHGNVIVGSVYLVGMTLGMFFFESHENYIFLADQVIRSFLVFYLLRRVFEVKRALLNFLVYAVISIVVSFTGIISIWLTFGTLLGLAKFLVHLHWFEKLENWLLRKKWLYALLGLLSALIYVSVFIAYDNLVPTMIFSVSLFFIIIVYHFFEGRRTVSFLKKTTSFLSAADLICTLNAHSDSSKSSEGCSRFVLKQFTKEFNSLVKQKLGELKETGEIHHFTIENSHAESIFTVFKSLPE